MQNNVEERTDLDREDSKSITMDTFKASKSRILVIFSHFLSDLD